MIKILYISDVNSEEPIFHSQVVPHTEELKKHYEVILLGMSRGDKYSYDYTYSSIRGDYFSFISYYNFLRQKNKLSNYINSMKIDFIYSRGCRGGLIGCYIKKCIFNNNIKLLNDVRGDEFDEHKYNLLKKLIFYFSFRIIIKNANTIFFVSSYLHKKYTRIFKCNLETAVFPTFVPDSKFVFNEMIRDEYREILGYNKDHIVLLYSGNLAKWQNTDMILKAFSKCTNKQVKLLFLTKDQAIIKLVSNNINKYNITHINVDYKEIQNFYFAADYGLLIRDNTDTNRCSSPTKFSEYVNSGLIIITTNIEADYINSIKEKKIKNVLLQNKYELEFILNDLKKDERNNIQINTLSSIVHLQRKYFNKF